MTGRKHYRVHCRDDMPDARWGYLPTARCLAVGAPLVLRLRLSQMLVDVPHLRLGKVGQSPVAIAGEVVLDTLQQNGRGGRYRILGAIPLPRTRPGLPVKSPGEAFVSLTQ